MAEIKALWLVHNVTKVDGSLDWLFEDPAVQDDEHRLAHYCGALDESGGYSIDQFVRVYWGGEGHKRSGPDKYRLYSDEASARKDAETRLKKDRAAYERRKNKARAKGKGKVKMAERVAARYSALV